ncbi:site-2 protease family protein, partial [Escherichia coli]|nr:site-2 protease family protein [Escherichia coli]
MSFWTIGLLLANLFLVVVVIALPLGLRTTRRTIRIKASPASVWQTLYPLGERAGFDDEIVASREIEPGKAWLSYAWRGRDDRPIERLAAFEDVVAEARYTMRVIDDTSLDPTFWRHFSERVTLTPVDGGQGTEVALAQTDRYRGAAFYIFRHFALRRRMQRLKDWLETGKVVKSRLTFEHPLSQVGFATISALLLWPLFGLTQGGLMAAALLTAVIALHELGHVAAFRIAGHRSARMIFIPLLGG